MIFKGKLVPDTSSKVLCVISSPFPKAVVMGAEGFSHDASPHLPGSLYPPLLLQLKWCPPFNAHSRNPLFACPDLADIGLDQSNPHCGALKHNFCLMTLNEISSTSLFTSLNYTRKGPGLKSKKPVEEPYPSRKLCKLQRH